MRPDLIRLAHTLIEHGRPFAVATVVRRDPPTSAQLGDTALITADGELHGWLGGVCTRETIVREARAALAEGRPRLVALSPDPVAAPRPGVRTLPMTCHSGGGVEIFVEPQGIPDRLVVFGATETAVALARLATVLGLRVEVADPDADADAVPPGVTVHTDLAAAGAGGVGADRAAADGGSDRPTGSRLFAVIATYGERDADAVRAALSLDPDLVTLVAGRRRFEALREALVARGLAPEEAARIESPAGLDIGARTPGEIALSILARIVEARRAAERAAAGAEAGDEPPAADAAEEPSGAVAGPRRTVDVDTPAVETEAAIDPVCGMAVTPGRGPSAEHEGRLVHFCCDGCRERFLADPEAYSVTT